MGIIRPGPPIDIILKLKETYGIKRFIETGTYIGDTAYWASKIFEQVITIEFSKNLYDQVIEKYAHIPNIEFLYGDSPEKLKEIISRSSIPSIFWLDAHWSGGQTYGKSDECPLTKEIDIINHSQNGHFILIDDARLFLSPPPHPYSAEEWPNITNVLNGLRAKNQKNCIVIIEDVIICVPSFARAIITDYCQDENTRIWEKFYKDQNVSDIKKGFILVTSGIKDKFKKYYKNY